ncbi:MAG: ABC transporter permease subunit [Clostridiaceae bacterium]|nr:ABC transporter permease subunit [Clostridiaceae bacterium]
MNITGFANKGITIGKTKENKRNGLKYILANYQLYLLMAMIMLYFIVFKYLPMYGLSMAFMNFDPILGFSGSEWVGVEQFKKLFGGIYFWTILKNTLSLSLYSLLVGFPFPIIFALFLNAVRQEWIKKPIQTVAYAPHFISTVVIVGMLKLFLSPSAGIVNRFIEALGGNAINFFAKASMFPSLYVWSDIWQNNGWNAVIYIAALSAIDPELHEAAKVDGAGRFKRMWHIDLPGIMPTIIILLIFSIGGLINVGFEKVFLMQNDLNISTSEIIATYSYKVGLQQAQYSYSAAVGMFNSVVNFILLMSINFISRHMAKTSLW